MGSGKLVVGQAGGATTVINASLVGVVESALAAGYQAVYGMRRGAEGALEDDYVDLTNLGVRLTTLAETPGAALASSRKKVSDDEIDSLLTAFSRNDVSALVYIGGNDSADTVHRLVR